MSKSTRIATVLIALGVLAVSAYAGPKTTKREKAVQPARATPAPKRARVTKTPGFADDLKQLTTVVALTEEQQKKLEALKLERDAAAAKWDEANQKRIDAIEAKLPQLKDRRQARTRSQLERQLKTMKAGRARLLDIHERKMFAVLEREQRGKWNGPVLAEPVLKEFTALKLDDSQTGKIRDLAQKRGEMLPAPVNPKRDEAIVKAVTKQAYASVLTPAQRKQFDKLKKPTPTRTRSTDTSRERTTERR